MTRRPTLAQHLAGDAERTAEHLRADGLAPVTALVARAAYRAGVTPVVVLTGERKGIGGLCAPTPQAWLPSWLAVYAADVVAAGTYHDASQREVTCVNETRLATAVRIALAFPEDARRDRVSKYVAGLRDCMTIGGVDALGSLLDAGPRRTARPRTK